MVVVKEPYKSCFYYLILKLFESIMGLIYVLIYNMALEHAFRVADFNLAGNMFKAVINNNGEMSYNLF